MTLKIEAGKWYRDRQGTVIGPMERSFSGSPPFVWAGSGAVYSASGAHSAEYSGFRDLVEEVTAPEPVDSAYGGPIPPEPDVVDHPPHYTTGGIECYDAMAAMLSCEEMIGYLRGNSFKYRWRFRHKGGAEDLRKAAWYESKLLALVGPAQNAT